MKRTGRNKLIGILLIVCGLLLLSGGGGLAVHNAVESREAGEASHAALEEIEVSMPQLKLPEPVELRTEMPKQEAKGYEYLGIVEIPDIDRKLPVLADYEFEWLTIAPCRFSGSYLTNDMILCSHNYPAHFDDIRYLSMGAPVVFTAVDGTVYEYEVTNRLTLQPDDLDILLENSENSTDGQGEEWDLTLFTCDGTGQTRCVVRCMRTN